MDDKRKRRRRFNWSGNELFVASILGVFLLVLVILTVRTSGQGYVVPDSLVQTVRGYWDTNVSAGRAGTNWLRVLIAFGAETHDTLTPMTASEARERVSRWQGWEPIADALEQFEAEQAQQGEAMRAEESPPPTATTAPATSTPPPTSTAMRFAAAQDEVVPPATSKLRAFWVDGTNCFWWKPISGKFYVWWRDADDGVSVHENSALVDATPGGAGKFSMTRANSAGNPEFKMYVSLGRQSTLRWYINSFIRVADEGADDILESESDDAELCNRASEFFKEDGQFKF